MLPYWPLKIQQNVPWLVTNSTLLLFTDPRWVTCNIKLRRQRTQPFIKICFRGRRAVCTHLLFVVKYMVLYWFLVRFGGINWPISLSFYPLVSSLRRYAHDIPRTSSLQNLILLEYVNRELTPVIHQSRIVLYLGGGAELSWCLPTISTEDGTVPVSERIYFRPNTWRQAKEPEDSSQNQDV